MMDLDVPDEVRAATARAVAAGITGCCAPGTGRLLAALAAAVARGGRVLELGTGTGVGTAWINHGLAGRLDVEFVTVERDAVLAQEAKAAGWPAWVQLLNEDALEALPRLGTFDLIFADADGGTWDGLVLTIAALRPGGHLLVDDMAPPAFLDPSHEYKTRQLRSRLLGRPDLVSVEIAWSGGLILATKCAA